LSHTRFFSSHVNAHFTRYSFAAGLPDGSFISAVAGFNDREAGTPVTTTSLFPAGSVAKPFLTVAALRLADPSRPVDKGGFRLDLDAPAVPIVDAWLAAQGEPTFTSMWQGDPLAENFTHIGAITIRMLLSMSSGVHDYDDEALERCAHACSSN
jgi:CubicO group peptidase (beta-lactamase class C family)